MPGGLHAGHLRGLTLVALVAAISATGEAQTNAACQIDGSLDVADVQTLINEAKGVNPPNNDLNADGVVNVVDIEIEIDAVLTGTCLAVTPPPSATVVTNPGTVPAGNSTVQVTVNITRDTAPNPLGTLVGSVVLSGIPRTMVLFQNGQQQLAYVCADSYVNIVDVTTPAHPQVLSTFAHGILTAEDGSSVSGYQGVSCAIDNHDLILAYSRYDGNTTDNPIPTHFATFSLADPLSPVQVGSVVDIARSDSAGLYLGGNIALLFQSDVVYDQFAGYIIQQNGDIWTADLTTAPSNGGVSFLNDVYSCGASSGPCPNVTNIVTADYFNGVCMVTGTTPVPNDPTKGGPYRIFPGTAANATTFYLGSSSSYFGNTEPPECPLFDGQLLVVDTSQPAAPSIASRVDVPAMAFLTGIAVQGSVAVAVGDSTGIYNVTSGFVGTLVISSFDITNPATPVLLSSLTTQLADTPGAFIVALGNNMFAVGNTSLNGQAELVLVDTTNPRALRYTPYAAPTIANPTIAQNGYFFALSATPDAASNALSVFQLAQIDGPQLTVKLQLPTTNCQNHSFSLTPSSCTPGSTSDTYEFDQPAANSITFTVSITGATPGAIITVVIGGEIDYTAAFLGAGVVQLGPVTVTAAAK